MKSHKVFSFYELDLDLDGEASSTVVTQEIIKASLDKVFPNEEGEQSALSKAAEDRRLLEHQLVRAVLKDGLQDDTIILGMYSCSPQGGQWKTRHLLTHCSPLDLPNTSYTELVFPEAPCISNASATARALLSAQENPTFFHIGCRTVSNGVLLSGINAWGSGGCLPKDGDRENEVCHEFSLHAMGSCRDSTHNLFFVCRSSQTPLYRVRLHSSIFQHFFQMSS